MNLSLPGQIEHNFHEILNMAHELSNNAGTPLLGSAPAPQRRSSRLVADSFGDYDVGSSDLREKTFSMPYVTTNNDDDNNNHNSHTSNSDDYIDPNLLVASSPREDHWPGRNIRCCFDTIWMGSGGHSVIITLTLTISPVILFMLFVLGDASETNALRAAIGNDATFLCFGVSSALLSAAIITLVLAATTEPGIIPRQPRWKEPIPPLDPMNIKENFPFKYCHTCNIYRPHRAKHCSYCNNCVLVFDHHCPWTGNCVGLRNYHYFLWFVTTVNLLCAFVSGLCIARFVLESQSKGSVGQGVSACPYAVGVGIFAFLILITTLPLWLYHVCTLLVQGETTNENLRATYANTLTNPFNNGFCSNFKTACGTPSQPSMTIGWKEKLRQEHLYLKDMRRRGHGHGNLK